MKHIAGWFRRNNTIMAQAKDLSRQLNEAWNDTERLEVYADSADSTADNLRDQLHRVARERDQERREKHDYMSASKMWETVYDQERKKWLAAEDALIDMYLDDNLREKLSSAYWTGHANGRMCGGNAISKEEASRCKDWLDAYLEQADNEEE